MAPRARRVLSNYQYFHRWELKACDATDRHYPKKSVVEEGIQAWGQITNQQRYADILRRLEGFYDTTNGKITYNVGIFEKARKLDKQIYAIPKRFSQRGRTKTVAEARRLRWRTLVQALKGHRKVILELERLDEQQDELGAAGYIIASVRALDYTALLLRQVDARVAQIEHDLEALRDDREDSDDPVSSGSDYSRYGSESSDDGDDDDGGGGGGGVGGNVSTSSGNLGPSDQDDEDDGEAESGPDDEEEEDEEVDDEEAAESDDSSGEPPQKSSIILKLGKRAGAAQKSGFKIKLAPRKRKSSERDRSSSKSESPTKRRRSTSAQGGASQAGEGVVGEGYDPAEEYTPTPSNESGGGGAGDDGFEGIGGDPPGDDPSSDDPGGGDSSDDDASDDNASDDDASDDDASDDDASDDDASDDDASESIDAPFMTLDEFNARWSEFDSFAKSQGHDDAPWNKEFNRVRAVAKFALEREGWAIVPTDLTEETDVDELFKDLKDKAGRARAKVDEREEERESAAAKSPAAITQGLGYHGTGKNTPEENVWIYKGSLGDGTTAFTSLWVRFDDGVVIEQVAIKDIDVERDAKDKYWLDPKYTDRFFYGPHTDRNPREAHMHNLVSKKDPQAQCIVLYRGTKVLFSKRIIRLYMEFCDVGELYEFWIKFANEGTLIPTAAVWALFEASANALFIFAYGCKPGGQSPADWERMVHRDIKPENVFMSWPDEEIWKNIPRMKVADFGAAGFVSESIIKNTRNGTPGFMPPEVDEVSTSEDEVGSPADIFSLGIMIVDIMNGGSPKPPKRPGKAPLLRANDRAKEKYPAALVELAHRCVQRAPKDRITIAELCERIEEQVDGLREVDLSADDKRSFKYYPRYKEIVAKFGLDEKSPTP